MARERITGFVERVRAVTSFSAKRSHKNNPVPSFVASRVSCAMKLMWPPTSNICFERDAQKARAPQASVRLSGPVLYCGGRGREKFTAVLSPGKGFIESAKGSLQGLIWPVRRLRLKNQLLFRGYKFSRFRALGSRAFVLFKAEKNTNPAHFPRGRTRGFAMALRERWSSFSAPKTLFRKRVQW